MDTLLETKELRVEYDGVVAVKALSFNVSAGQVFGLIGHNGAGKTSTMRVLASLNRPTFGRAFVMGLDVEQHSREVRAQLGFMPDMAPVYDELKVWEMLDFFAHAHGLPRRGRLARVEACLDMVGMLESRDTMTGTLSRGMTQRVVLAKTLLHDPAVLILDEPASGVDPEARLAMRQTLRSLADRGKAVLVSSHILSELDDLCDMIGFMHQGEMETWGSPEDIVRKFHPHQMLVVRLFDQQQSEIARQFIETQQSVYAVSSEDIGGRSNMKIEGAWSDAHVSELVEGLVARGIRLVEVHVEKPRFEDIMLAIGKHVRKQQTISMQGGADD